jgi:hypothetical protein
MARFHLAWKECAAAPIASPGRHADRQRILPELQTSLGSDLSENERREILPAFIAQATGHLVEPHTHALVHA